MSERGWRIQGSFIVDGDGRFVCNHAQEYGPLLAAAPELYEALEKAANVLAAVAGDLDDGHSLADLRGKYVLAVVNARDDARAALAKAQGAERAKGETG